MHNEEVTVRVCIYEMERKEGVCGGGANKKLY